MEEQEMSLKEKVDILFSQTQQGKQIKSKKIKIPRKAKTNKRKMKKGYVGSITINENLSTKGERVKIEGGAFRTGDGSYHATDGREILFWEGKYPILFQPTWRKNPINFFNSKDETYGQKPIMARMIGDAIPHKKKANISGLVWMILIIVGGYLLYTYVVKGGI